MIFTKNGNSIITILKSGGIPGYLLMGYYVVKAVFERGKIDASAIDATAIIFMFYSFLCLGVGLYFIFNRKNILINFEKRFFLSTPFIWFVLYTALGFVSALWSLQYQLTIYRSIESLAMLFLMVATMKELLTKGIPIVIQWTINYVFIVILIRFLQFYLLRGISLKFTIGYGGVFECAQMIAPVFFFLGLFHAKNWYVRWTFIIFSILSMSTTGYLGIALGIFALVFGNTKIRIFAIFLGFTMLLLALIVGPKNLLEKTVFIEKPAIDMEHTSGRNQVWEMGYEWFLKKPFTGYGFVAGESYLIRDKEGRTMVIGMHNSIMSALIGEGIFGAVFIVLFFLGMFRIIFSRHIPLKYRPALIAIFLSAFVQSMGNPGIGSRVYGSWMSAMYVCILISSIYIYNKYRYKEKVIIMKLANQSLIQNK